MEQKAQNKREKKRKLDRWLIALLSVLLTCLILEGGMRLFLWIKTKDINAGLYWKIQYEPYLIHSGLNPPSQLWPAKSSKYRILILGGSTAQYLPDRAVVDAFQKSGKDVEVINFGNNGFIVNQDIVMLALYGIKLQPDLIISLDGANDIIQMYQSDQAGVPFTNKYVSFAVKHPILNVFFGIFRNSQFINMAFKLKDRFSGKAIVKNVKRQEETLDVIAQGIDTISVIAAGLKIPYIAVLQPYRDLTKKTASYERSSLGYLQSFRIDMYQRLIAKLASNPFQNHVYYVDGTKAFDKTDVECFRDGVHLSEEGSRILMDFIYDQAVRLGYRFEKN